MTATAFTTRRELAHRTSDGIEITLFWTKPSTRVTVAVLDTRSGEALEFEVAGNAALDPFNHPYAYAATGQPRTLATTAPPTNQGTFGKSTPATPKASTTTPASTTNVFSTSSQAPYSATASDPK